MIAKGVTANADWLLPAGYKKWDILADDWLTENNAAENVTDSSVWGFPHRLQIEFFDTLLIGSDGRAFDSDVMLEGGISGVDGDSIRDIKLHTGKLHTNYIMDVYI